MAATDGDSELSGFGLIIPRPFVGAKSRIGTHQGTGLAGDSGGGSASGVRALSAGPAEAIPLGERDEPRSDHASASYVRRP